MIRDLDDLVAYTDQAANALPDLAAEIRIVRPGYPPDVIVALSQALPGLPKSYLAVVESIAIDGIAIGYFQLTPSSSRAASITDKLRSFNDPTVTPMAEQYKHHGVYQVAAWEADPICVAHADGAFRIGQVVKYSAGVPRTRPVVLADSFEQFLLIAANLDEIRANVNDPTRALGDFRTYLAPMTVGRRDDMESAWMQIANVVLG